MTNILLTGITGFIGSHLAKKLIEEDFKLYALIRHSPRQTLHMDIPNEVVTIHGDLLDIHSLKNAIRISQPEYIFHLAAMTPVRHSFTNPFLCGQINYLGTMNIIHAALQCPVLNRYIHASTVEVYKHKDTPIKEEDELYGSTPYGVSKVAGDYYVRIAGDCYGLPFTITRPSNTYGRKTENGYFIEKVITTMLTKNELLLDGRPELIRSFMYVDDHVQAYLYCMKKEAERQVFNFAPKHGYSVGEIVEKCKELLNWKGEVVYATNPRPSEGMKLEIDATKAKEILGWKAQVSLEEGLQRTINYWRGKI